MYKIPLKTLETLKFEKKPVNILYKSSKNELLTKAHFLVDYSVYQSIKKIFEGDHDIELSSKETLLILPGQDIGSIRIDEAIKNIECKRTKDVNNCTLIVGSDMIFHDNIVHKSFGFRMDEHYEFDSEYFTERPDMYYNTVNKDDFIKEEFVDTDFIITESAKKVNGFTSQLSYVRNTLFFISMDGMEMLYMMLYHNLKVSHNDNLNDQSYSNLDLSKKNVYENITNMINSENYEDKTVGWEMLYHCKVETIEQELRLYDITSVHDDSSRSNSKNKNAFHGHTNAKSYYGNGFARAIRMMIRKYPDCDKKILYDKFKESIDNSISEAIADIYMDDFVDEIKTKIC